MKVGRQQIINELGKRIIGQSDVIELICCRCSSAAQPQRRRPRLAKTLLIATLAKVLELKSTASSSRPT